MTVAILGRPIVQRGAPMSNKEEKGIATEEDEPCIAQSAVSSIPVKVKVSRVVASFKGPSLY
jgi:hypothetical protein